MRASARMTPVGRAVRAIAIVRWLLPVAGAVALVGFWGPWVDHRAAGLVILGLDLGEYVKFLPEVRGGAVPLWREGFYLPLVAVSLAFSLAAFRAELAYRWFVRVPLVALAISAALNLLPPAWTPQRLLTPEFQQQTAAIVLCLAAVALGPFLALLPRAAAGAAVALLAAAAAVIPAWQFARVLDGIAVVYHQPLAPGVGLYGMEIGLAGLLAAGVLLAVGRPPQPDGSLRT